MTDAASEKTIRQEVLDLLEEVLGQMDSSYIASNIAIGLGRARRAEAEEGEKARLVDLVRAYQAPR